MKDWKKVKLKEIAKVNSYTIKRDFKYKTIEYVDISSVGTGTIEKPKVIKLNEAPSRAKRTIRDGSIILSTVRPNRRSFYYFKNAKENLVVSTGFAVLDAKEVIFSRFLYYLINDYKFTEYLTNNAKGAAYPAVDKEIINRAVFFIPTDVNEQKKISTILSNYDELIENNNRRIKILEEMAQTIYKEWFVHFKFPGHEKIKLVDSELGRIPEGWEIKRLSKVVDTQYGYTESASEEIIGPKFLRGKDINKNSYIIWDEVPYCKIEPDVYEKYKLNREDIVIIRMADPGKAGIIEKDIDAVFASYLIRLKIKNDMEPYYLFYFLLSDMYQSYISGASTGTTRKSARAGVITNIDILLPDKNVLDQFGEVMNLLRQLLNTLLKKSENLRKSRDLLLPKLISSEIGVSDLDINTGDTK